MKIAMQNFQPMAMFNKLLNGHGKSEVSAHSNSVHQLDKKNIATNIMQGRLAESLGMPQQAANDNSSSFDFEKVAENVLGFVKEALLQAKENGADDNTLKNMLYDAKKGIKMGIADASAELEESGLMTDDIKNGIHEANSLLKEGLKDLSEQLVAQPVVGIANYREASLYNLSNAASFSFTTQEGDQVDIQFNAEYLQQNATALRYDANSLDYASSSQESLNYAFSFAVNGDLNEDEQAAINELMGNLQNVSELFFDGDLEQAFEQALEIGMDTSQLSAFSMNLQRTETYASVKEYQQVLPAKEIADQLMPLNNELSAAYEKAKPLALENQLASLLEWLNEGQPELNKLLEYSQAVFEQLASLDNLVQEQSDSVS